MRRGFLGMSKNDIYFLYMSTNTKRVADRLLDEGLCECISDALIDPPVRLLHVLISQGPTHARWIFQEALRSKASLFSFFLGRRGSGRKPFFFLFCSTSRSRLRTVQPRTRQWLMTFLRTGQETKHSKPNFWFWGAELGLRRLTACATSRTKKTNGLCNF